MFSQKKKFQKGFTLVELLVTISIFVVLTGIVLFNQSRFNSTILLTNLAYDTALTIRQAQTYGINIKEFDTNGTAGAGHFVPYGVHFDKGAKSFILFADIDSNGLYDGSKDFCSPSYSVSIPGSNDGCVSRYNITRGNYIKDICKVETASSTCPSGTSQTSIDVTFVRPNPDAHIRLGQSDTDFSGGVTVILGSSDGANAKEINIQTNGLIQIATQ